MLQADRTKMPAGEIALLAQPASRLWSAGSTAAAAALLAIAGLLALGELCVSLRRPALAGMFVQLPTPPAER